VTNNATRGLKNVGLKLTSSPKHEQVQDDFSGGGGGAVPVKSGEGVPSGPKRLSSAKQPVSII